jgi:hypothetical protein
MEKDKWVKYILVSGGMKFKNKKVPVWHTGIYRPISGTGYKHTK